MQKRSGDTINQSGKTRYD